jgi:pyruvate kinase
VAEAAFSFVHDGHEATLLRRQGFARIVAKLERPEALGHLGAIDRSFDELWLCRGDLGAQAGLPALGRLQAEVTAALPRLSHPVFLAGGVLAQMVEHREPTRSEVVHLYDVARAGYAGVVLSDETAVGRYPLAAARAAAGRS